MQPRKVDVALEYADRGWKVIALSANSKIPVKSPLQEHGSLDATDNPNRIRELWGKFPDANIGIATGRGNNLTVVDMDSEAAREELAKRFTGNQAPPPTYGVKTPNGYHAYFQYDPDVVQSAGRILKVDIRNDGGYVVAAGSSVNGKSYEVVMAKPVARWDFPEIFKKGYKQASNFNQKWYDDLLQNGAHEGTRNDSLYRVACRYRGQGHDREELTTLVHSFNQNHMIPPLPDRPDVESIIEQALKFERGQKLEYVGALIEPPLIEAQTDRRSTFFWVNEGIRIELSGIEHFGSRTYCKMKIHTTDQGLIYMSTFSLFDERSRTAVRGTLRERHPIADWTGILHHIAVVVDTHTERPSNIVDLAAHTPKRDSAYLIYPVVRRNQASVIYADGGTGKSTFALALACTGALQQSIIPGINPTLQRPIRTMYLDWESDEDDVSEMTSELARGANTEMPSGMLVYQNMSGAFIDHVDSLVDEIVNRDIELIIVDSLVASAGGDVTDAEAARYYFNAVRSLNVASIGITHTNQAGTLYGNRFFWNLARQVFRLASVAEAETDPVLGLFHEKANRSQLVAPMAWNVIYRSAEGELSKYIDSSIQYETADVQSIPELAKLTGVRDQIIGLLRNQSMTVDDISDKLKISDLAVSSMLTRFPKMFRRRSGIDNEWELIDE